MNTMTYEQATEQAIKLKKQGMTYPAIEEHLKNAGYISARTKKPVGALAIRHMVTSAEQKEKRELKDERPMHVRASSLSDTIAKLAGLDGIEEDTKITLIEALISKTKRAANGQ